MFSPIKTLFTYFPLTFFLRVLFLLSVNVVAAVIVYKQYKKNKLDKSRMVAIALLVFYITVVLFFTVLGRRTLDCYRFGSDVVGYYTELFNGGATIDMTELCLNVLVFVPIGVIACFVFCRFRVLWALVVGFITSGVIELCQLVLRNGYVSLTDVIHNTVGALLGGLLGVAIILIISITGKKSEAKVEKDDAV